MYQFLGRDTLALRCSAQESLFIRKVFRKRDFLWCEINFTNPVGLAENHICDHFNHSKLLVADDEVSTCGSTNIDFRSFENNFESNVFFYDRQMALRIKELYMADEAQSVDFNDVDTLRHRPYLHRLTESLFRLLAPLL